MKSSDKTLFDRRAQAKRGSGARERVGTTQHSQFREQ